MGKRPYQRIPLRERIGKTYDELVAAEVTVTHLPWDIFEGRGPDTWILCALGCERAYQLREAKWVLDTPGEYPPVMSIARDGLWYCAYFPDCEQDAVIGAWTWNGLLAQGWEGPPAPVRGIRYPLYPSNG